MPPAPGRVVPFAGDRAGVGRWVFVVGAGAEEFGDPPGDVVVTDDHAGTGGLGADMLVDRRAEGLPDQVAVDPGCGDPPTLVVVADPDHGHVVGVAVDFPPTVHRRDPGVGAAVWVQLRGVIDPVVDCHAVLVDHAPPGR
jgi:hypothetical protein